MSCAAASDRQRFDCRDLRAVRGRVRCLCSFCVVAENGLMEAHKLRLGAGGGLGDRGVGEALGGRLGGALAVGRVWGGCEGCAGRERIRCNELGVLQLEGVRQRLISVCEALSSWYAVNAYALALDADDDFCALPLLDPTNTAHSSGMDATIGGSYRLGQRGQGEGRANFLIRRHGDCRENYVRCEVEVCGRRCAGRRSALQLSREK
jgi:hypothetical protein